MAQRPRVTRSDSITSCIAEVAGEVGGMETECWPGEVGGNGCDCQEGEEIDGGRRRWGKNE